MVAAPDVSCVPRSSVLPNMSGTQFFGPVPGPAPGPLPPEPSVDPVETYSFATGAGGPLLCTPVLLASASSMHVTVGLDPTLLLPQA